MEIYRRANDYTSRLRCTVAIINLNAFKLYVRFIFIPELTQIPSKIDMLLMRLFSESPIARVSLSNPLLYMRVRQFSLSPYEAKITAHLRDSEVLQNPTRVVVEDRSGGCGANFYILVESTVFKGIPRIRQHRLVQDVLKDEIAKWHAVSIETRVPSS